MSCSSAVLPSAVWTCSAHQPCMSIAVALLARAKAVATVFVVMAAAAAVSPGRPGRCQVGWYGWASGGVSSALR
eukprot:13108-Prorocentrum_lima.AAC.1